MEAMWDIAQVLQQPSLLEKVSVDIVESWVQEYPYYDLAHLLLLKKYQQTDKHRYEQYLPVAALYATDRGRLQALMADEQEWPQDAVPPAEQEHQPEQQVDSTPQPAGDSVDEDLGTEEPQEEESRSADTPQPADAPQMAAPAEADTAPVEQHSFLGWLQYLQQQDQPPQKSDVAPVPPADSTISDLPESPIDASAYMEAMWQKEFSGSALPDLSGIGKGRVAQKDLDDAELRAKKSVEMGDELVTETLARIFVLQGHDDRAIATYEKLRLKYPEKSDYFAAKIAELQQKRS